MLKSLDVLIGLVVVLLALSMTVTVITQALTTLVNSRGAHLRRGLADLLQLVDPAFDATTSKALASRILTHPLVSGSSLPSWLDRLLGSWGGPRLGNVVHREEFIKLLMGMALEQRPPGAATATARQGASGDAVRDAVNSALASHGIDPKATLEAIRATSMELERTAPELSNMARQSAAILTAAPNDFVAKITSWFDQTMDRTSQRFTASTRAVTFVGAFVVAFGLQVDTPGLVNRLAADDTLRAALIEQATVMDAAHKNMPRELPSPDRDKAIEREYRSFLARNGIIAIPSSFDREDYAGRMLGMLLTALLLSLGAPFWYSALSRLLQLRSVLARKDDVLRAERQLTTTAAGKAGGGTPAP